MIFAAAMVATLVRLQGANGRQMDSGTRSRQTAPPKVQTQQPNRCGRANRHPQSPHSQGRPVAHFQTNGRSMCQRVDFMVDTGASVVR
jgi:predicted aspartyl protease